MELLQGIDRFLIVQLTASHEPAKPQALRKGKKPRRERDKEPNNSPFTLGKAGATPGRERKSYPRKLQKQGRRREIRTGKGEEGSKARGADPQGIEEEESEFIERPRIPAHVESSSVRKNGKVRTTDGKE